MHRLWSTLFILFALAVARAVPAAAEYPCERLPPTPALPKPDHAGTAQ